MMLSLMFRRWFAPGVAVVLAAGLLGLSGCDQSGDDSDVVSRRVILGPSQAQVIDGAAPGAKPYPLEVCLVGGGELGSMGPPIVKTYQGQQVKFCCQDCTGKFQSNPEAYLSKLKVAAASSPVQPALPEVRVVDGTAAGAKPYPLEVCLVGGGELGTMGPPIVMTYQGQQIKLCCQGCTGKFEQAPGQYLSKLKGLVASAAGAAAAR